MKAQHELSAEEMLRAVGLLKQAAGIEKIRLTGGDPLVTPKFDSFLPGVMDLGMKDVSLTTNGQLLLAKKDIIAESGLQRINISLDTLNALKFRHIARGGDLETVLKGVESMVDLGLRIKINMVPMRSQNFHDILPMLDYCLDRGIELRFIELMHGSPL
jgi:cyclic pyranopterin phosphate synthase